jgi:4-hydroxythreonine-4-phosphate dehydrogenase
MNARPIALTIGDPAGIGPELSLRVASDPDFMPDVPVVLIGSGDLLRRVAEQIEFDVDVRAVDRPEQATATPHVAHVMEIPMDAQAVQPGVIAPANGQATFEAIELSAKLALDGQVAAVCCAPANKEAFNVAGHHFEGQTEIYAHLTGTERFHTVLVGGPFRVSLVSAHCSMLEAVARVTQDRIERILGELDGALRHQFGIEAPRIGVAGLNPHAGENGIFGREEIDHVRPALENCRARGMDLSDPLAADSLFWQAEQGKYDAVLAMYHDQGTIPLKRYGYVTLAAGLPIIRTTAGHGTAFDIAWTGKADAGLLARAARLAAELGTSAMVRSRQ